MNRLLFISLLAFAPPLYAITYPQLAIGGGYECLMRVSNKTGVTWQGDFTLYRGNQETWNTPWKVNGQTFSNAGFNLTLGGYGTASIRITGDGTTRSGYLEYYGYGSSSSFDVAVSYFYQFYDGGRLITSTGSPAGDSHKTFYFPVEKTATTNTGLAWSPWITTTPFEIRLTLYQALGTSGVQYDSKTIIYSGHDAKFFDEIFDRVKGLAEFIGFIKVEAADYFYLEVLRLDTTQNGFLLTSTPPDWMTP